MFVFCFETRRSSTSFLARWFLFVTFFEASDFDFLFRKRLLPTSLFLFSKKASGAEGSDEILPLLFLPPSFFFFLHFVSS